MKTKSKKAYYLYEGYLIPRSLINDIKDMWIDNDCEGEWNRRSDIEDDRVCMEIVDGLEKGGCEFPEVKRAENI